MCRPSLKQFLTAWLAIAAAGVLAGRVLIPEESKQLCRGIEGYWLLLVLVESALELYLLVLVARRVQALLRLRLHLMAVKPWIAWLADILTLWSMLYLVAEYRASQWRPVSLDRDSLLIRNGVFARDREIAYNAIESVVRCDDNVRRQRSILRYRQMGRLNVEIRLREGGQYAKIYLSLDQPGAFIDALRQRLPQ